MRSSLKHVYKGRNSDFFSVSWSQCVALTGFTDSFWLLFMHCFLSLSPLIQLPFTACNEIALKRFHSSNPESLRVMVMRYRVMSASPSIAFPNTTPLSIFLLPPFYYTPVTASLMEWISVFLITFFFFLYSLQTLMYKAGFIEVCASLQIHQLCHLWADRWWIQGPSADKAAKHNNSISCKK